MNAQTLALCAAAALAGCATTAPQPPPAQARTHHYYKPRPSAAQQDNPATVESAPPSVGYAAGAPAQDGPPNPQDIPVNLANIPDAVPRPETPSDAGNPEFYEVGSDRYYVLKDSRGFKERGAASWYGNKFQGRHTSSGEPYDMFQMTAAHKTLPIPCYVRVTNLRNGLSTVVRVNDRGPFHSGRIIDLSYAAALKIGVLDEGSAPVEIETVEAAPRPAPEMIAAAPVTPLPAHAQMTAVPDTAPRPALPPPAPAAAAASAPVVMAIAAAAGAPPAAAATGAPHYLQAGLFKDVDNAATLRERLNGLGIVNVLLKTEARGTDYVHRVLVGPFADAQTLDAVRKHMAELQLMTVPVVE